MALEAQVVDFFWCLIMDVIALGPPATSVAFVMTLRGGSEVRDPMTAASTTW